MAFKVLDEEQMALFTDDQKKQYEEALERYNARAAFVERMDVLESVELTPHEPRLQEIALIGEIPESDYAAPEYTVKTCVLAARPEPRFNTLELEGTISADLPQYSKVAKVEVGHIKKVEAVQPQLPETVKVEKVVIEVDFAKREEPCIPDITAPNVLTVFPEEPEKVEAVLPMVAICFTDIKEYKKPEQAPNQKPRCRQRGFNLAALQSRGRFNLRGICQIDANASARLIARENKVPTVRKPNLTLKSEKMEPVHAMLPELTNAKSVDVKFTKVELSETELPAIVRPKLLVHEFTSVEYSVSDLSAVKGSRVKVREAQSFAYERRDRRPQLPTVEKISAADVVFKPIKAAEPMITVAPISPVRVRSFAKVESKAGRMPGVAAVVIPDARERLKELLSAKEEHESLEETGS